MSVQASRDTFVKLNSSPWMGAVSEAGLGVPFMDALLKIPGSSGTLLFGKTPYNKLMQPDIGHPSVSREMVEHQAEDLWLTIGAQANLAALCPPERRFTLAVSGSFKTPSERGDTHAWVCLRTAEGSNFMHFSISKMEMGGPDLGSNAWRWLASEVDRAEAIRRTGRFVTGFVSGVLNLEQEDEAEIWANNGPNPMVNIDVVETPNITLEQHLRLVNQRNPLVFFQGRFQRATSILRRFKSIFRGSFNPPHNSHLLMGRDTDSIFEISVHNARKGRVDFENLAHRIRMLDLLGVPVMITSGCPTFVSLHNMLKAGGLKEEITYVVGIDTMQAILSDDYVPHEDFLHPLRDGARFDVFPREGHPTSLNGRAATLDLTIRSDVVTNHSSTNIRLGNGNEAVPLEVLQYIEANNLYDDLRASEEKKTLP